MPAILFYLAKKSGRLIPGDRAGEAQVMRWCFAAMDTVEPPLLGLMLPDWTADGGCGKHREFLVGWVNRVVSGSLPGPARVEAHHQAYSARVEAG